MSGCALSGLESCGCPVAKLLFCRLLSGSVMPSGLKLMEGAPSVVGASGLNDKDVLPAPVAGWSGLNDKDVLPPPDVGWSGLNDNDVLPLPVAGWSGLTGLNDKDVLPPAEGATASQAGALKLMTSASWLLKLTSAGFLLC